jgi:hypothetical protein
MNASPEENSGKAFAQAAEEAYDKLAEEHGIDEHGDEIVDIDDDEPALEAEEEVVDEVEEPEIEDEEEPIEASDEEVEDPAPHIPSLAPETWSQEWKETFAAIPEEGQKAMLEMNKHMNSAFTKRMMETSNLKRDLTGITRAIQPHQERLQMAGISPDVAIQRSLAWDAHIQKDPQQGIVDMAKAYGVDLSQATTSEEMYLTPTERALKEQAERANQSAMSVQQQMQQWQQMQQQQEYNQRVGNAHHMLQEFTNATDEKGNPLHPYIEHAAPQMTQLIQNKMASGLEDAYEMAVKLNPQIQEHLNKRRQASQVRQAQRKAEKVRKASKSGITTKARGGTGKPVRSTEDQVAAAYDKLANA